MNDTNLIKAHAKLRSVEAILEQVIKHYSMALHIGEEHTDVIVLSDLNNHLNRLRELINNTNIYEEGGQISTKKADKYLRKRTN